MGRSRLRDFYEVLQGFVFRGGGSPGVSGSGEARVFFDGTKLRISENGGAFANVQGSSITVRKNSGANVGVRPRVNLIEGGNITLTVADDGTDDEVDLTIAATGGTTGVEVLNSATTTVSVTNTVIETDVYSFSVVGGKLGTTNALRLSLIGEYRNNSGAAANLQFRCKYGATTVLLFSADESSTVAPSTDRRAVEITLWIFAGGATGSQRVYGRWAMSNALFGDNEGRSKPDVYNHIGKHGSVAEDSTAAKTLAVTVQHGTAHANITFTMLGARLEHVK